MKRIKILHQVLDPSGIGGVSSEFRSLKVSSLSDKYDIHTMVLIEPHRGINLHDIKFYYKHICEYKPDIVHIRGAALDGLNAVIAAKLYGKTKIFVAVHGMYSDIVYISRLKKWISKNIVERLIFTLCDGISCVCKNVTDRSYFNRYRKKMLPFVYNRIPKFNNEQSLTNRTLIRNNYNINEADIVFAFIGRISKEKGIDDMFAALDSITELLPENFTLLIVGNGDYFERTKEFCKNKPYKIVFAGYQSNVEVFYHASDVFILPSLHENHSISLLEACAANLPCIVTDCGGNAETIVNNQTGLIVPVGDISAMSQALLKMLDEEFRKKCINNQMREDYEKFSNSSCDKALDFAYKTLLKI